MRKLAIAVALASTALATPAVARDGSAYVGVGVGPMIVEDVSLDLDSSVDIPEAIILDHKYGLDAELVAGYDFGMFRVEGELAWKRAYIDEAFVAQTGVAPFDPEGRTAVLSAMLNALLDFGGEDSWGGFVGGGLGLARVDIDTSAADVNGPADFVVDGRDSGLAWQAIAGVRAALSPNVDLGLKYRFFSTRTFEFEDPTGANCGPFGCVATSSRLDGKFRSHSLLATLTYNFFTPPPPPPPPVEVAPPPPPPPPPATQTCPDGSVILATEVCPAPPPPPPPPPPAPERG